MAELLIDPDCRAQKCKTCVGGPCQHYCHVFAAISGRINDQAAEWPGLTRQEARALVDRVAELEGCDFRLAQELERAESKFRAADTAADIQRRRAARAESERDRIKAALNEAIQRWKQQAKDHGDYYNRATNDDDPAAAKYELGKAAVYDALAAEVQALLNAKAVASGA